MSLFIFLFCAYITIISSVDAVVNDFYWRDYTYGNIPCDAYQGAPGLYIGQVPTKDFNTVANIYLSTGNAITAYADDVLTIENDIKIFCSGDQSKFYWENVDFDQLQDQQLQDAVRGGYQDTAYDPLFIGKVMHQGEWKIGKVNTFKHGNNKGIWVWNQQQHPVNVHQFQILKYNATVPDTTLEQDIYWREYVPGSIPHDAFEGAPNRYVGQMFVNHENRYHVQPATIYPDIKIAVAELFGKKVAKKDIKILCSPDNSRLYWEYVDMSKLEATQLKDAVKGGYEYANIYIGKVQHEDEWKIGKVIHEALHLWDLEGKAVHLQQFYVLKYNSTKTCHN